MNIKTTSKQRKAFVDGILSVAISRGVSKAEIKREAFSCYSTGNRRIEHHNEELTLTDIFNIAALCKIPPAQLITGGAKHIRRLS